MIGLQNQLKKDKMIESKTSDMMKAVRKGGTSGPWDIIISKNNKIVKRVSVKNLKEIPAEMTSLLSNLPKGNAPIFSFFGPFCFGGGACFCIYFFDFMNVFVCASTRVAKR